MLPRLMRWPSRPPLGCRARRRAAAGGHATNGAGRKGSEERERSHARLLADRGRLAGSPSCGPRADASFGSVALCSSTPTLSP